MAVRDLVYLNKKSTKTLSSFPLPQRGMLGLQAQIKVQQQKLKSFGLFHQEYVVSSEIFYGGYNFRISGRIDGVYELKDRIEIEEIKSVILTVSEFRNLHIQYYPEFSEQVLFYGYLLSHEKPEMEIKPYLTLINLVNDKTRTFLVEFSPPVVERLLFQRFQMILDNLKRDEIIQMERKKQLASIQYPLHEHRPQQEKMMKTISTCLKEKEHLMISAPTGTGKTAAALYPSLEYAIENQKNIFFITAKTTQQKVVQDTLSPVINNNLAIKVLFLRSVRKMCLNEVFFCHEDFCPFAKHYHERLLESNLIAHVLAYNLIYPDTLIEHAKRYSLCPAEVMMDLTAYSDIIVGDYNYVFDPTAYLRRLFQNRDYSDWILIIDEAHNLYQRGMDYFSPAVVRKHILDIISYQRGKKPKVYNNLIKALEKFNKFFEVLQSEGELRHEQLQYYQPHLDKIEWQIAFNDYEAAFIKYQIHKLKHKIFQADDPFESLFYNLRRFTLVIKLEGSMYLPFYDAQNGGILKIQCCDPSEHLESKISGFHSVIAMSATLDPIHYYRQVLGFSDDRTKILQLDSPFPTENRKLLIFPGVSTRYINRHELYPKYAEIINNVINIKKGNYIVFCPSFEFLQNINLFLATAKTEKILQRTIMSEKDRDQVLTYLKDTSQPKLLLAVMGGIFSEGIDFSGDMCIGIIIFSPALPKISYERELIRSYYENNRGNGFEYAYLYPGMNKVIQATGRLIRSHQDKGIVLIVGERFGEERVNTLFPEYWFKKPGDIVFTDSYVEAIQDFWDKIDKS